MNKSIIKLITLVFLINILGCNSEQKTFNEKEYLESIQEWQVKRLERLKSEDGWLNLVGLHWIKEGQNPFGSSIANNIVFPEKAPDFIGTIILFRGNLSITINEDIEVFVNDSLIQEREINTDAQDNTTIFRMGSFKWHVIQRGERFAIRLRDLESPLIDQITEIPSFPIDSKWRVEAKFEKFDEAKKNCYTKCFR
jgi:uncharacterized protein (DUF1684 family)